MKKKKAESDHKRKISNKELYVEKYLTESIRRKNCAMHCKEFEFPASIIMLEEEKERKLLPCQWHPLKLINNLFFLFLLGWYNTI